MKRLIIGSVALLGLAGCNPGSNGFQATVPTPTAPAPTTGVSANPPDRPTGSQGYQSPDLDRRHLPPGQDS